LKRKKQKIITDFCTQKPKFSAYLLIPCIKKGKEGLLREGKIEIKRGKKLFISNEKN
jgi:hypothetical protein